ncbi:MAG: DUF1573 domain-containing protein [Bacteroidia bacterium]
MKRISLVFCSLMLTVAFISCQKNENAGTNVAKGKDSTRTAASADAQSSDGGVPDFQKKAEDLPKTKIKWFEEEYDFKEIKEGEVVTHTFKFQNDGTEPLVITHVKPSCGCTATNWTKEPIEPGKEGMAEIKFDSKGRPGPVQKTITVYGNYEGITHQIKFKGEVKPDPNAKKDDAPKKEEAAH